MKIRNKKDLELAYFILKCYVEDGKRKEKIDELKREIRRYVNQPAPKQRVINGESALDSCILLVELPLWITDKETAEEWFEAKEVMECRPSQYDCTGQLFTAWYKIFKRRGSWWAYHCIAMDV